MTPNSANLLAVGPQLKRLFDHEKGAMRTVAKAGVTQFVWNKEQYGDEAGVDHNIVRHLLRLYPNAEARRRAVAALERGETYTSPLAAGADPSLSGRDVFGLMHERKTTALGLGEVFTGLVGAVIGAAIVTGLELLLALAGHALFGGFIRVAGIGLVVLPIMGAIAGFYVGAIAWLDIAHWLRRKL